MEFAALASFAALVLAWIALPATRMNTKPSAMSTDPKFRTKPIEA